MTHNPTPDEVREAGDALADELRALVPAWQWTGKAGDGRRAYAVSDELMDRVVGSLPPATAADSIRGKALREAAKVAFDKLGYAADRYDDGYNQACRDIESGILALDTRLSSEQARPVAQSEGLVEKVARAICIDTGSNPDAVKLFMVRENGELNPVQAPLWQNYCPAARAALSAIPEAVEREPVGGEATRYGPKFAHLAPLVEAMTDDQLKHTLNPAVVAITEAAIMCLDADEDNAPQLAAFERALLPILAALSPNPEPRP